MKWEWFECMKQLVIDLDGYLVCLQAYYNPCEIVRWSSAVRIWTDFNVSFVFGVQYWCWQKLAGGLFQVSERSYLVVRAACWDSLAVCDCPHLLRGCGWSLGFCSCFFSILTVSWLSCTCQEVFDKVFPCLPSASMNFILCLQSVAIILTPSIISNFKGLDRLKKWADGNLMKFNKWKRKVPSPGRNAGRRRGWETAGWKAALQKRTSGSQWKKKWLWASDVPLQQRRPTASWAALGITLPAGGQQWSFPSA